MEEKELIRIEEEIENIESLKYHVNSKLNELIERMKRLRFDLKYKKDLE